MRTLKWTALLLASAGTLAMPTISAAQTTPEADEGDEIMVVTGYSLQNQRAISAKRDAQVISEFVTSDDAGQNPDYNIADALRRVPGVAAVFDEDEGRYVAVRGLNPDYTLVTLNGSQLASSDQSSRRVLIEQVPASAVARMQVVKSLTPQYDGNAIGGLVDLQTRSAFDQSGMYLNAQALLGYYDSNSVPGDNGLSYRADATLSSTFGPDDAFGIVLTGSYMERTRDQERMIITGYNYYTAQGVTATDPANQDVSRAPSGVYYLNYALKSKRFGGAATLEYKPDSNFYASLYYSHYTQDDDETRYGVTIAPSGVPTLTGDASGSATGASVSATTSQFVISKPVDTAQARIAYDDGSTSLDLRGSYSQARWDEIGPGITLSSGAKSALAYSYDIDANGPNLVFTNPAFFQNEGNYALTSTNSTDFNVSEQVKNLRADLRHTLGESGWALGVGGAYKDVERTLDRESPSWASTGLTGADFALGADYTPPYATGALPMIDRVAFWDYFKNNPARFTYNETAADLAGLASDYVFGEKVAAAYAMAEWKGPNHALVFGGRYEHTDVDVSRYSVKAGVATPVEEENSYGNFLPSAVFSYDLSPSLKLRAAYSKALGRPNQTDLAGSESRSENAGIVTISRPNRELKPRKADNFDLSAEYYFPGNNGLISAGVFHKNVKDEIFRGTTQVVDGAVTYIITEPQNLESAKLSGLELNLVMNSLPFLPPALSGLGVSLNYTYIHTDAEVVMANGTLREVDQLLEQPAHMFNASVFYRDSWFEGRLSYSRPGQSYQAISTASAMQDVIYEPFNQLDAQVRLQLTDQVMFIAEGRNLLGESRNTVMGVYDDLREINAHGRGFWAGVSFSY